jgi:hypothetical protein
MRYRYDHDMTEAIATQTDGLHYVVLAHLTALPSWLQLTRPQRQAVVAGHVRSAFDAYPTVAARWIDTEGFSADCSDVLMADTDDLRAWNHLFERLRDSPIFAVPYFRLDRLIVGAEDAYADYENARTGDA